MSDETDTPSARPRTSRFREHTNTANSIKPPPDELWKDLAIDQLIDDFNEENSAPPATARKVSGHNTASSGRPSIFRGPSNTSSNGKSSGVGSRNASTSQTTTTGSEGPFGRFQRAFASVFGGVLGKRKAGSPDAERNKEQQLLDERKQAAETAYQEAKEQGLLPTPKMFVRPGMAARHVCAAETPNRATPRTPSVSTLRHTPSKKDLHKQKKLSKRVSDLEHKLASARKELQTVLYDHDALPPVPPLPTALPPTPPITSQSDSADVRSISAEPRSSPPASTITDATPLPRKITKKRKATSPTDSDSEYKPIPTDSEGDIDLLSDVALSERELEKRTVKRAKSTSSRKSGAGAGGKKSKSERLQKRASGKSMNASSEGSRKREESRERPVTVVPDGVKVPFVPELPRDGMGRKEGDDGYGGLEHEMF